MATVTQTTSMDTLHDAERANDAGANDKLAQSTVPVTIQVGKGDAKRTVTVQSRLGYEWDMSTARGFRAEARTEGRLSDCDTALQTETLNAANDIASEHRSYQRSLLRDAVRERLVNRDRLRAAAILKHAQRLKTR